MSEFDKAVMNLKLLAPWANHNDILIQIAISPNEYGLIAQQARQKLEEDK